MYQIVLLFLFVLFSLTHSFSQETEIVYLSGTDATNTKEWDFYCTDGRNSKKWSKIQVPSNWELQGFGTYNYGHDWYYKTRKLGKEHGLYRHSFEIPSDWKGKVINIVFDGSMTDTKVKVNGTQAGEMHQGGSYRFKYDISKLLKYGKQNLLEVDVAKHSANQSINGAERQADYWIFGGIFRPVFLEILPVVHMNRTSINAKAEGDFNTIISLNKSSKSNYSVAIDLYDLSGKKIGETIRERSKKGAKHISISGKFKNIKSWNPEHPNLYDMKISLLKGDKIIHQVTERIGFRTINLRKHDGIYVNGKKVIFKGASRHSFWPETGRALSEENYLTDIRLMKEMNMNAVRQTSYVSNKRFLQLCDSLGLFVLAELSGWQDAYDTIIGPKLIKEMIIKDENHPSIVIWNHGNEDGWNFANEKYFNKYDIQKRPVLYPIILRNGIDAKHYPHFNFGIGRFVNGNDVFLSTEILHGLYDGGLGAGLDSYWRYYKSSPLFAGCFLWALIDEAVLRVDKKGVVYDSDGNHASDGIVGPHREKEGSFYTIKEIWSPVQVMPVSINQLWDGKLFLKNEYIYSNLSECSFSWKAIKTNKYTEEVVGSGKVKSPNVSPGETAMVQVDHQGVLKEADLFFFTAIDSQGKELYTWSWPVKQTWEIADRLIGQLNDASGEVKTFQNEGKEVSASANGITITFSTEDGVIKNVKNQNGDISFSGGPIPVGVESKVTGTNWIIDPEGNFIFTTSYSKYPHQVSWKLRKDGLLAMEASPLHDELKDIDFIGLSFNYPEEKCQSIKWMGRGPYRVWKNRIKGSNIGVWEKSYNNTITGESFNNLIYPEFKGYHGNLYWVTMETSESPFTIISGTPNLYFRLFTPDKPQHVKGGTYPSFPEGDISFLYDIPAIGTKFKSPDMLGPDSQKGMRYYSIHGETNYPIKLWFDFRPRQIP